MWLAYLGVSKVSLDESWGHFLHAQETPPQASHIKNKHEFEKCSAHGSSRCSGARLALPAPAPVGGPSCRIPRWPDALKRFACALDRAIEGGEYMTPPLKMT